MERFVNWFKTQISTGNILVIVFMAVGFYYTTEFRLGELEDEVVDINKEMTSHINYQFEPLEKAVRDNEAAIQRIQGNYKTLEQLIQQQQENNEKHFQNLSSRQEYIIKRLDRQ